MQGSALFSTIHVENSVYSPPSRTSVAEALADSDEDVGLALTPNSPVAAAPGRLSRSLSPGAPSTESYGSGGQQQRGSFEEAYKVVVAEHSVLSVCEAGLEDRWRSVAACVLAILLCCVVCVELPRVFDTRDPDHPSQNWFVAWVYGTLFFNAAAIGCRRAIRMYEPALPRRSAGAIAALAIYLAVRVSLLRPRYFKSGFALFFLCYGASVLGEVLARVLFLRLRCWPPFMQAPKTEDETLEPDELGHLMRGPPSDGGSWELESEYARL